MIESKDINEFCDNGNVTDLYRFINKKFSNMNLHNDRDAEIVNGFVLQMMGSDTIERFDSTQSKFSTYIFSCFTNYIKSYHLTVPHKNATFAACLSLDYQNQDGFNYDETIPDESAINLEEFVDRKIILEILEKHDADRNLNKTQNGKRVFISRSDVYRKIVEGRTMSSVAKDYGVTTNAMCTHRNVIIKLIKKSMNIRKF